MRRSWSPGAGAPSLPAAFAIAAGIVAAVSFAVPPCACRGLRPRSWRRSRGSPRGAGAAVPRLSAALVLAASARASWSARARWLLPAGRTEASARAAIAEALARDPEAGGALVEVVGRLDAPWSPSGSLRRTRLDVESASCDGRAARARRARRARRRRRDRPVAGRGGRRPRPREGDCSACPSAAAPRRAPVDLPDQPHLLLKSGAQIERISGPSGPFAPVQRARAALKRRLRANLAGAPEADRTALALLLAFVLGETQDLPLAAVGAFRDGGVAHIVAISGLQVALVAALLGFLVRKAGASLRARDAIVLVATLLFAVFAGGRPPVWRAALMIGLYLAARLLGRPTSPGARPRLLRVRDPPRRPVGALRRRLPPDVRGRLRPRGIRRAGRRGPPRAWRAGARSRTRSGRRSAPSSRCCRSRRSSSTSFPSSLSSRTRSSCRSRASSSSRASRSCPLLAVSPAVAAAAIVPLRLLSDLQFGILDALRPPSRRSRRPDAALRARGRGGGAPPRGGPRRGPARPAGSPRGGSRRGRRRSSAAPPAAAAEGTAVLRAVDVGQGDAGFSSRRGGAFSSTAAAVRTGHTSSGGCASSRSSPTSARSRSTPWSSRTRTRTTRAASSRSCRRCRSAASSLPRAAPRNVFLDEVLAVATKRRLVLERFGAGARFEAAGALVRRPPSAGRARTRARRRTTARSSSGPGSRGGRCS